MSLSLLFISLCTLSMIYASEHDNKPDWSKHILIDGDILIRVDDTKISDATLHKKLHKRETDSVRNASMLPTFWPKNLETQKFEIRYCQKLDPVTLNTVEWAMNYIATRSLVEFIEIQNNDTSCQINIVQDNFSYSSLGYDAKHISYTAIGPDCSTRACAIHELMHLLGFTHEHARPNRDNFITVEENLPKKLDIWTETLPELSNIPYDYMSIMHYKAIMPDGSLLYNTKDVNILPYLQLSKTEFSEYDLYRLRKVYGNGQNDNLCRPNAISTSMTPTPLCLRFFLTQAECQFHCKFNDEGFYDAGACTSEDINDLDSITYESVDLNEQYTNLIKAWKVSRDSLIVSPHNLQTQRCYKAFHNMSKEENIKFTDYITACPISLEVALLISESVDDTDSYRAPDLVKSGRPDQLSSISPRIRKNSVSSHQKSPLNFILIATFIGYLSYILV